jgi:hypothetical protein
MKNLDRAGLVKHVKEKHPKDKAVYFFKNPLNALDVQFAFANHGVMLITKLVDYFFRAVHCIDLAGHLELRHKYDVDTYTVIYFQLRLVKRIMTWKMKKYSRKS